MASRTASDHECSGSPSVTPEWLVKLGSVLPTWRGMAHALGLRRLQELFQGTCSLSDQPVWLLGVWYGASDVDGDGAILTSEAAEALLRDFAARLWFTYRREFPAIGGSALTSDVGWGCTLRSGQMLLAEALVRHAYGRITRLPASGPEVEAAAALVGLFLDGPSLMEHPFSIHAICRVGAPHGVVAGKWLGPWVLCHALQAAVQVQQQQLATAWREHRRQLREGRSESLEEQQPQPQQQQQQQQQQQAGHQPAGQQGEEQQGEKQQPEEQQPQLRQPRPLVVHVLCSPGGGAPSLQPTELLRLFQPSSSTGAAAGDADDAGGTEGPSDSSISGGGGAAGDAPSSSSGGAVLTAAGSSEPSRGVDVPTEDSFCTVAAPSACAKNGGTSMQPQQQPPVEGEEEEDEQQEAPGVLILVPLTLGVGKINEVYHSQLRAVLTFPQSVGVVGGRPGASLYFIGWQDPGAVLYLDPHETQEVAVLPHDLPTYSCATPRLVSVSAVDPSLAIGFYCASPEDATDLCERLAVVAAAAGNAPLLTIDTGSGGAGGGGGARGAARAAGGEEGSGGEGDWEIL